MDKRIQHGEPACAAALDHQFVRVSQALRHHGLRAFHRILHIQPPPGVAQRLAVGAPKAGAAAVVDLQEGIPSAGEEQPVQAEAHRSLRSRPAVHINDQRGQAFSGAIRIGWGVIGAIHRDAIGRLPGDRLRLRRPARSSQIGLVRCYQLQRVALQAPDFGWQLG